jgi:hypothetical protein
MSYDELTTQDKINAYVVFVYQQDKLKQAQVDSINKLVGVDQPIVDPTGKPIVLQAAPSPAVQVDPANG